MDAEDFERVHPFALISEVKKYPALYDNRTPEYKNASKKEEMWNSIYAALFPNYEKLNEEEKGVIKETVRKRWQTLQDTVLEDHRLREDDQQYGLSKMTPIVEKMQFLIPYITKYGKKSNFDEPSNKCTDPEFDDFQMLQHRNNRCDDTMALISEVKKYPALYNNLIPEYNDAPMKEEIWESIIHVLYPHYEDLDDDKKGFIKQNTCQRWKKLQQKVIKDYRLREKDSVYRKTEMTQMVEEMQFLIPYINKCNDTINSAKNPEDYMFRFIDPLALISEVKKYPALYYKQLPEHDNRLMKEEIWESITDVLFPICKDLNEDTKGVINESVRKRWKLLRSALMDDYYLRKNDRVYRTKKMTQEVEDMQFFIPYLNTNRCKFAPFPEDFGSKQDNVFLGYVAPFSLISEVKKYPALYNNRILEFKNVRLKEEIWLSIIVALFPNYNKLSKDKKAVVEQTVHQRWRSLRYTAIKDYRLRCDDAVYRQGKMTRTVEEMQFIIPYVKIQKTPRKKPTTSIKRHSSHSHILKNDSTIVSTFQEDPESSYSQVHDDEEQSTNKVFNPPIHMTISEAKSEEAERNTTLNKTIEFDERESKLIHKRKRADSEQDLHSKLSELIDICKEDSDEEEQMFLLALLSDFKRIPVENKLKVKKAFITALDEALE